MTHPLRHRIRRIAAYLWVAPVTLVGLALAGVALACGARARWVEGQLEVAGAHRLQAFGRCPPVRDFVAITLGHVILGRDHATLDRWRAHEREHVRQYERWGVLFWPLYLGASGRAWLRGRDPYRDNVFEVAARRAEAEAHRSSRQPTTRLAPQATHRPSNCSAGESGQRR